MNNENIVKDLSAGVMVVNRSGQITLMNDSLRQLLPYVDDTQPLSAAIEYDGQNSAFYDVIVDSVLSKNCLKNSVVEYIVDGKKLYYDVRSRFSEEEESVILSVNDITNEVSYRKACKDATLVSAVIISFLAVWNLLYVVLQRFLPMVDAHSMTLIIMGLGCFVAWFLIKKTDLSLKDMGFEFKGKWKAILLNASVTALIIVLMTLYKVFFVKDYEKLFDFSALKTVSTMYYPLTVIIQEVLSRGIMHLSLERVFKTKHGSVLAILVSSLTFAALHIQLGLMYMLGAGALLCLFGFIYKKQRSIWALCIPHYFLCIAASLLGFL